MDKQARGRTLQERILDLGYSEVQASERVGIARSTLRSVFEGRARETSYRQVERWLEREIDKTDATDVVEEMASSNEHVAFRFTGNYGVNLTVEGPVSDIAQLREAAKDLLRELQREASQDATDE